MTERITAPGEERLNEQRIVEAALAIIERDGVPALSMRALATELGVTQMAPYYYVKTKEDLFSLVLEHVLSSVDIPATGRWDVRLASVMRSMIDTVAAYPGLGAVLVNSPSPPSLLRIMRAEIDILREAGFSDEESMLAFSAVYDYVVGRLHTVDEIRRTRLRLEPRLGIERIDSLHGRDYVDFGVIATVDGLKSAVRRRRRS